MSLTLTLTLTRTPGRIPIYSALQYCRYRSTAPGIVVYGCQLPKLMHVKSGSLNARSSAATSPPRSPRHQASFTALRARSSHYNRSRSMWFFTTTRASHPYSKCSSFSESHAAQMLASLPVREHKFCFWCIRIILRYMSVYTHVRRTAWLLNPPTLMACRYNRFWIWQSTHVHSSRPTTLLHSSQGPMQQVLSKRHTVF
ncbi:hypothetical protein PENSPDRAFT_292493 [Peniophora sp. CONT]|nr:hypothetical protein PENSPDRAFT_292493 [Peniophora sp. CONT]